MKRTVCAAILALSLMSFVKPNMTTAQISGSFASGSYQFSLEDGYTKFVEFEARALADGGATGQMILSDEAEILYQDVDGTGDLGDSYKGFYLKADFDELVVNQNQAVISGTVRDSSIRTFIGQRVLITVEDNGDNTKVPDRLTWGIYQPVDRRWVPTDAELKDDDGWRLTWIATDAERKEDEGALYARDILIDSRTFALSSYSFAEVERGAGDIVVQP